MTIDIPYVSEDLILEHYEVGPVTSQDVTYLLTNVPKTESTTHFRISFNALDDVIRGSSGRLSIDIKGERFRFSDVSLSEPSNREEFERILDGGRLEHLNLRYPGQYAKKEYFDVGGRALTFLGRHLKSFLDTRYEAEVSSLIIGHYLVEVSQRFEPGLFASYAPRIAITTGEMVKGEPERKLILGFTHDLKDSLEVGAYRGIFDSIKAKLKH